MKSSNFHLIRYGTAGTSIVFIVFNVSNTTTLLWQVGKVLIEARSRIQARSLILAGSLGHLF